MPVTIVATVGGASSNSYATLAETDAYMEGRLNSTLYDAATDDTCNRALVEATRELTRLCWNGRKASDEQALAWPRDLAVDPDSPNAWFYDNTEIPQRVKDATMELAFQFINAGTTDLASLDGTISVISKTVGPISTTYAEPYQRAQGLGRFPRVQSLIAPLLESYGSSATVVRG